MRMKRVVEKCTLSSAAAEFYAFKRAQKIRERTLYDYQRYIDPFVAQSSNSMNVTVLKREILAFRSEYDQAIHRDFRYATDGQSQEL